MTTWDLVWGVKPSFVAYLQAVGDQDIAVTDGAEIFGETGIWRFPGAAEDVDGDIWADGTATFDFAGELRLRAHDGMLDVRVTRPRVSVVAGVGTLLGETANPRSPYVRLGSAPLDPSRRRGDGSWALDITLDAQAVQLFNGSYAAGTPLAPVVFVPAGR